MNSLDRQNTKVLARYLYEVAGKPEGHARELRESAEKQLHENVFEAETGPLPMITPAQVQARVEKRIAEREKN